MNPRLPPATAWASLVLLAACSAPSSPSPPPQASVRGPTPPLSTAVASATASAAAPPDAAPEETVVDFMAAAVDKKVTKAPCDFTRAFRGKVGDAALSIAIAKSGDAVTGSARYDAGSGELELSGTLASGELTLRETVEGKPVGTMTARCDAATGALSGTWVKDQTAKPLALKPLSGATPLAQQGRQLGLAEDSRCTFNVASPVVFGLHDAGRTGRINAALKLDFLGVDDKKIERDATACAKGAGIKALGWYAIEANENGLLSVTMDGYLDVAPSVHGDSNAAARAVSIDVPTGKVLALSDIVTSTRALRPVVKTCMEMTADAIGGGDAWWWEREIQGVPSDKNGDEAEEGSRTFDPKSLHAPAFLVVPDGLAVLIPPQSTAASDTSGKGPVIQWGALLRAGISNDKSPVSRLWAGQKPLPNEAPACVRFFRQGWSGPPAASPK